MNKREEMRKLAYQNDKRYDIYKNILIFIELKAREGKYQFTYAGLSLDTITFVNKLLKQDGFDTTFKFSASIKEAQEDVSLLVISWE